VGTQWGAPLAVTPRSNIMKIYKNRKSAGQILAERLKNIKADLVLGIPRGGVVVASEVVKKLKLPLDIIVTRKIGAPSQPELALGAVDPDAEVTWEENLMEDLRLEVGDLGDEVKKQWKELKRREDLYRGDMGDPNLEGKKVILVDDGMATGSTALAAVRYLKRHGAKIILAIPVASKDAMDRVSREIGETGEIIVLEIPDDFRAVGQFYQHFEPVTDEEVVQLLK